MFEDDAAEEFDSTHLDVGTSGQDLATTDNLSSAAQNFPSTASMTQPPCDLSILMSNETTYQHDLHLGDFDLNDTAFDTNSLGTTLFGTNAPHMAFWEDPEFMAPIYLDTHLEYDMAFLADGSSPGRQDLPQHARSVSDEESTDADHAPVPSFLDARSSPEPQHGQSLRLSEFFADVWADHGRKRDWIGRTTFRNSGKGEMRYSPPLMGTFSSVLSSTANQGIWEAESLAHVKPLQKEVYTQIVAHFKELNSTNVQYNQFVAGEFPSLAACNAFLQLFFEDFNQLFPLIHQPTFDPDHEHWLLILSMLAIGSRFSQQASAVECADILQEFVHRAFQATVCLLMVLTMD